MTWIPLTTQSTQDLVENLLIYKPVSRAEQIRKTGFKSPEQRKMPGPRNPQTSVSVKARFSNEFARHPGSETFKHSDANSTTCNKTSVAKQLSTWAPQIVPQSPTIRFQNHLPFK